MRSALLLCIGGLGILLASCSALEQAPKPVYDEEAGYLDVRRDHVRWPSPESVASDLRSDDEGIRLKALSLSGMTDAQTHEAIESRTFPSRDIGKTVVTPDQIQLTYASLGEDTTKQAILAVQIGQLTFAAIAAPAAKGWERIAAFDCWCKYEMEAGADALAEFVQLHLAPDNGSARPQHYELVLRGSGGGTGIYVQNEVHFRMHGGELRRVISFESQKRSCDPTGTQPPSCQIEKRWFYPTQVSNTPGAVLVDGRGRMAANNTLAVNWFVRELQIRDLKRLTCTSFKWNQQQFSYERLTVAPDPCEGSLR